MSGDWHLESRVIEWKGDRILRSLCGGSSLKTIQRVRLLLARHNLSFGDVALL